MGLNSLRLETYCDLQQGLVPPLTGPHVLHGTTRLTRFGEQSNLHFIVTFVLFEFTDFTYKCGFFI